MCPSSPHRYGGSFDREACTGRFPHGRIRHSPDSTQVSLPENCSISLERGPPMLAYRIHAHSSLHTHRHLQTIRLCQFFQGAQLQLHGTHLFVPRSCSSWILRSGPPIHGRRAGSMSLAEYRSTGPPDQRMLCCRRRRAPGSNGHTNPPRWAGSWPPKLVQ